MSGVRVVLDTHVLLDLWAFADPAARPLLDALIAGRWIALRSVPTDEEFLDVLARPRFGVASADRSRALAQWHRLSVHVPDIRPAPWICRDPHDQKFLDLACSAGAQLLLTRDRVLLALDRRTRRDGLRVCTPLEGLRFGPDPTPSADGMMERHDAAP